MKTQAERDSLIFSDKALSYSGGIEYFDDLSLKVLKKLVESGDADLDSEHNSSPSIREMIVIGDAVVMGGGEIKYNGYAVDGARSDYGVDITGFEVVVSADEAISLVRAYRNADDLDTEKLENGDYNIYFWWD